MGNVDPESAVDQSSRDDDALRVAGNELKVFLDSTSLIASMAKDIAAANRRVWLESYIIADDDAGRTIAAALDERARAGLDVRVVYDGFGSIRTPSAYFEGLRHAGVKVHGYHPIWQGLRNLAFLRLVNRRDHRKLLIIDDSLAYFGGMNIVDQRGIATAEDAKARNLPSSGAWRDVHVRLEGKRQSEIADVFDRLWSRINHSDFTGLTAWPRKAMLSSRGDDIFFFDCRPSLRRRRPQRIFAPLIRKARRQIIVSMAYFIPQGRVLRELVKARKRGVLVSIVIPSASDVPAVHCATRYFYAYLLKRGFQIYEQTNYMLHSKVMVIDQEWSIVGSCNLDPRSLFFNLEFLAVIHSHSTATVMERICRDEMSKSRRVIDAHLEQRSWKQRFLDYLAWKFRKWL